MRCLGGITESIDMNLRLAGLSSALAFPWTLVPGLFAEGSGAGGVQKKKKKKTCPTFSSFVRTQTQKRRVCYRCFVVVCSLSHVSLLHQAAACQAPLSFIISEAFSCGPLELLGVAGAYEWQKLRKG